MEITNSAKGFHLIAWWTYLSRLAENLTTFP